jgi:hypothetical protein
MMSICTALPQLLTCLDVEKRQGKENGCEENHDQVLHICVSHFQPGDDAAGLATELGILLTVESFFRSNSSIGEFS